ncbi:hypothetical protein AO398_00215 [Methylobacterium sp. GXS13]|uniref:hypothetical protein n=1 Tax=Methylobacterium sp. GXS13 TaxID=1730094 RepID=UPI00071B7CDC|nr:hypothetical protein [Methylobacterium sp. GXS13]KST61149.1 hypothetical protein AO398_00215 [Methylobacterium sp. GXS13]
MMSTRRYEVRLATRDGRRVLTARAEREVALMAESVMRRYGDDILDVGFSVVSPEPAASRRPSGSLPCPGWPSSTAW